MFFYYLTDTCCSIYWYSLINFENKFSYFYWNQHTRNKNLCYDLFGVQYSILNIIFFLPNELHQMKGNREHESCSSVSVKIGDTFFIEPTERVGLRDSWMLERA
jgi:hypothetical protein